jgi:hypothetical protein
MFARTQIPQKNATGEDFASATQFDGMHLIDDVLRQNIDGADSVTALQQNFDDQPEHLQDRYLNLRAKIHDDDSVAVIFTHPFTRAPTVMRVLLLCAAQRCLSDLFATWS